MFSYLNVRAVCSVHCDCAVARLPSRTCTHCHGPGQVERLPVLLRESMFLRRSAFVYYRAAIAHLFLLPKRISHLYMTECFVPPSRRISRALPNAFFSHALAFN